MIDYLSPFEQLYQLNSEAYVKLDELSFPLIVVGGQALAYWYLYYFVKPEKKVDDAMYSVDIDYVAKIEDIRQINQVWDGSLHEASVEHPPPSLATILLENLSHEIKQKNGALFIDTDEYEKQNKIKANLVDIIDFPKGFDFDDFNTLKGLELYTTPFIFPSEFNLKPHEKLRVLTPIACLKSRLANHAHPPVKPQALERTRIRLLIIPIIYYLQDQLVENGFRQTKKQIDLLIQLVESKESINLSLLHQIHLIEILDFFANPPEPIAGLPELFIQKELPRCLTKISTKIEKLKTQRARFNHT